MISALCVLSFLFQPGTQRREQHKSIISTSANDAFLSDDLQCFYNHPKLVGRPAGFDLQFAQHFTFSCLVKIQVGIGQPGELCFELGSLRIPPGCHGRI
jgi:hypothetical protein